MPISGLTNVPHAFIKLGNIRKGEKVTVKRKDGSTYEKPVDLDYFRVTFNPGAQAEAVEKAFRAAYGDKPTEINVRFAENDISQVWDANYESYKQGGLIAQAGSNEKGAYWIFYRDPETSEVLVRNGSPVGDAGRALVDQPLDVTKPIYHNAKNEPQFLEPVGRLQVVIPETAGVAVGYFVFQPGSPRDIRNISAELGAYDAMAKQYGKSINGIPFILRRREEQVTKNIKGVLSKGASWVVHLDAGGEWGQQAISMIERLALPDVIEAVEVTEYSPEEEEPFGTPTPPPASATPLLPREAQDEMIDPLAQNAVAFAAQKWNMSVTDSAKQIGESDKFTNPMSKAEFKRIVEGG